MPVGSLSYLYVIYVSYAEKILEATAIVNDLQERVGRASLKNQRQRLAAKYFRPSRAGASKLLGASSKLRAAPLPLIEGRLLFRVPRPFLPSQALSFDAFFIQPPWRQALCARSQFDVSFIISGQ